MPCALALGNKSTSTLSDEAYLIMYTSSALNCDIFCKGDKHKNACLIEFGVFYLCLLVRKWMISNFLLLNI
ncbi:hypothetical protein F383_30774 [Gossypium arboreum]|uniref:Uncharacterized protein n=1 Tax=Gossypium arboreum TaxID=29729 RepID=A0A0B0N2Q3_GOSAR|nr:hypothetical protein F383_30774 [Gossypium arboreum]